MRADADGLRGRCRPAIQRPDRELHRIVAVGGIAMRRIATGAGRPVAQRPRLRREPGAAWVEGLVKELDDIEHRRVEREKSEGCDRRRRGVEAELERAALAE